MELFPGVIEMCRPVWPCVLRLIDCNFGVRAHQKPLTRNCCYLGDGSRHGNLGFIASLKSLCANGSFAPLGLDPLPLLDLRLARRAAFLPCFAAEKRRLVPLFHAFENCDPR